MAPLPETVSPGQLITADLINAMLAALRGSQSIDERFRALAQSVAGFDERLKRIESLIDKLGRDGSDLRGLIDRLRIDRDDMIVKIDDLRGQVIPKIQERFTQIDVSIAERFDPIERRINEVELRVVRDTDPIERLPGMTPENINLLRSRGIENVAAIKARRDEIPAILNNDLDAARIGNMIERFS
jgi:hypothetical protein